MREAIGAMLYDEEWAERVDMGNSEDTKSKDAKDSVRAGCIAPLIAALFPL